MQTATTHKHETVTGTVARILYPKSRAADAETDFRIFHLQTKDETFSVKGSASTLKTGSTVLCDGIWEKHPKFGTTLKAMLITEVLPTSLDAIESYLAKAHITGLGPKTAKVLVAHFGEGVFDILDRFPERLLEVKGIKTKTAGAIIDGWQARRAVHTIMLFLQSHHVQPAMADKVFRRMGGEGISAEAIIDRIKRNPYIISDIHGIGFKTADDMVLSLGIPRDSPHRVIAGLAHTMDEQAGSGHTMLPWSKAIEKTSELIGLDATLVSERVRDELLHNEILESFMVDGIEHVALGRLRRSEERIASNLDRLKRFGQPIAAVSSPVLRGPFLTADGFALDASQESAVRLGATMPITVITGRPGTGKTSTMRAIIQAALTLGKRVACCAPTGLAAIRLSESTGVRATTIHRLLGLGSQEKQPPLQIDLLVCDETSMMDSSMTALLLEALPNGCALILVGDVDQLPSVGPGNVLHDIIASGVFPVARLTHIHRTKQKEGKGQGIVDGAHAVIEGTMPAFNKTDFRFIDAPRDPSFGDDDVVDEGKTAELVPRIVKRMHELGTAFEDIQVLAPMRKGVLGVNNLNAVMQNAINPPDPAKAEILFRGTTYRVGDRIMQRKNDYALGVVNGDIGYIEDIDLAEGTLQVSFTGGRAVALDKSNLEHVSLSYVSTIHQSQGSGFKEIIVPLTTAHYVMLNRNLLYTAITRAKLRCVLLGTKKALGVAVRTKSNSIRCTGLERLLAPQRPLDELDIVA
jgi:exodeoxyribonuclease V alpha subunit